MQQRYYTVNYRRNSPPGQAFDTAQRRNSSPRVLKSGKLSERSRAMQKATSRGKVSEVGSKRQNFKAYSNPERMYFASLARWTESVQVWST